MKIEIQKKDLLSLLSRTQNIVEKRNTMPILINVLLEAQNNLLKAYATDLEVSLTDTAISQVKEPGKVAVSAKSLFEITKELFDGPLTLFKKENNWLEIKQGKFLSNNRSHVKRCSKEVALWLSLAFLSALSFFFFIILGFAFETPPMESPSHATKKFYLEKLIPFFTCYKNTACGFIVGNAIHHISVFVPAGFRIQIFHICFL